MSCTCTVAESRVPTKSLFGVNVTFPVFLSRVYLPTSFPSLVAGISVASTSLPPTMNLAGFLSVISIGTRLSPSVNTGVPSCTFPWISVEVTFSPVGFIGVTVGVYLAVTGVPFISTRVTLTPLALPVNCGSGVNTTTPLLTSYLPSPGTVITSPFSPVSGLVNSRPFVSSIGTIFLTPFILTLPPRNSGTPFCGTPWISVVSAGVAVGCTPTTSGVYFVVATFPLTSSTCTVTLVALPTNCFSGVNSITPSFSTYLPSFAITTSLTFSPAAFTNVNVDLFSSTLSSPRSKLTVDLSSSSFTSNTTGDFWTAPWMSFVSDSFAVGTTSVTVGVYVAVAVAVIGFPDKSWPRVVVNDTVTGVAVPMKVFNGTNVTTPVALLIVYVPCPLIVTSSTNSPDVGLTNLAGDVALGTTGEPSPTDVKFGVPVWVTPWISVEVTLCPSILSVTVIW